jgi:hypothetical protein
MGSGRHSMLTPQARRLLDIPESAVLPESLDDLYEQWFAGRGYETRFGGGWTFATKHPSSEDALPFEVESQAQGYSVCLVHRTAQCWFALDAQHRVYVEGDEWIPIASSFVALVEEDAHLLASNATGEGIRGHGLFRSFEEFLEVHAAYMSAFKEVWRDEGFARVYHGPRSAIIASRFYTVEYGICVIEHLSEPDEPKTTKHTDPRTAQFIELLKATGLLTGINIISRLLAAHMRYAEAYSDWAVMGPLGLALTAAAALVFWKRWHWGQAVYFVVVALVLTFLQLLAVPGD